MRITASLLRLIYLSGNSLSVIFCFAGSGFPGPLASIFFGKNKINPGSFVAFNLNLSFQLVG